MAGVWVHLGAGQLGSGDTQ